MIYRMFPLVALFLALFLGAPALAADNDVRTHEGKVVTISGDQLVMTSKNGKEHTHALTADVKLTCDGKLCKCDDIKPGMKIRVTTKKDDKKTVTKIEALDKNEAFEKLDN